MQPWKRIEPTVVHKVGYRTLVSKTFEQPDGTVVTFDTMHPDGQRFVQVLGLTPENQVVVCKMFRAGPEMVMHELPGGFVDKGEELEAAARREFTEETGYAVGSMRYLGESHRDTYMNATWNYFLATDCVRQGERDAHEVEEQIEVMLIGIDTLIENARHDRMTDIDGVLYAYEELQKLKQAGGSGKK